MSKNEALDLAIFSIQHTMNTILLLQGNTADSFPLLNRYNDAIIKLNELKKEEQDADKT